MSVEFPLLPWTHDPSGQAMDYTFPLNLPAGESLASATITPVDNSDDPLVGDSLTITNVSSAVISGTLWGVTFYASGGTPGATYNLRCRFSFASSPARGTDRTGRMRCANT